MSPAENGLASLTACELRRRVVAGEVSALDAARAHLERISALDGRLHCFLALNPKAEQEARQVDRRIRAGERLALAGVPVAVKDNLVTAGLATTCGSRILGGFRSPTDATAVSRLRAAGAVVLGKTNLDEFAMGSSTETSAFGPTRNPWDPARVPGGSSGGSAAAVAARLAPLALGSDTGGSIRQPAAFCGVIGLKPTYGRVSRSGLVAYASSLDQVGPLTRSVADAASALAAIAGPDPRDATARNEPAGDYVGACSRGVLGLRVGLPREYFGAGLDPEIERAVRLAAAALEAAGATLEEVSLPHTRFAIPTYYLLATAEASSNLSRYDGVRYGERLGAEAGLRAMFGRTRAGGFGAEVQRRIMLGTYSLSAGYHERFHARAQAVRTRIREELLALLGPGPRVLLAPTTPTAAFGLGEKVEDPLQMYLSDVYTVTANLGGLPALALPVGRSARGLPLGAQLMGPPFGEELLFAAGAVLERAFPLPAPPCDAPGFAP